MYKIEKKPFGYKLTFGGFIEKPEMTNWFNESKKNLLTQSPGFGVFVDMRTLRPLAPDVQEVMQEGQKIYKQKGMQRSVVILENAVTTMQFRRIAKESGIDAWERYIDSSSNSNWEKAGIDWLTSGKEPE